MRLPAGGPLVLLRRLAVRIPINRTRSWSAKPFHGLPGDARDQVEVLVTVQHRQPGELGRRGNDEIGNRRLTMLPSVSQQGEDFYGPVFDRRGLLGNSRK